MGGEWGVNGKWMSGKKGMKYLGEHECFGR